MENQPFFAQKIVFFPICNPFVTSCKIFNFFTNIHLYSRSNVKKLKRIFMDLP